MGGRIVEHKHPLLARFKCEKCGQIIKVNFESCCAPEYVCKVKYPECCGQPMIEIMDD